MQGSSGSEGHSNLDPVVTDPAFLLSTLCVQVGADADSLSNQVKSNQSNRVCLKVLAEQHVNRR